MSYGLEITRRGKSDRDKCYDFIFERSPTGALHWLNAFEAAVTALLTEPHFGEAPESDDHKETIRQKLFKTRYGKTYRLLYLIRGDVIFIIHVRGPGQDVMTADELNVPESLED